MCVAAFVRTPSTPANTWLHSNCCLCVWLCYWVFVAVWSTVWGDKRLDFDKNAEWSVVKQQHMSKHTLTQSMPQTVSTGHYRRGKKDWKINSGHPAKAAAVSPHVSTTVLDRHRRRILPQRGTFSVQTLDKTELFCLFIYVLRRTCHFNSAGKRICIKWASQNTAAQWSRNRIKVWNEQFMHVVPLKPNENSKMFCLRAFPQ